MTRIELWNFYLFTPIKSLQRLTLTNNLTCTNLRSPTNMESWKWYTGFMTLVELESLASNLYLHSYCLLINQAEREHFLTIGFTYVYSLSKCAPDTTSQCFGSEVEVAQYPSYAQCCITDVEDRLMQMFAGQRERRDPHTTVSSLVSRIFLHDNWPLNLRSCFILFTTP